MSLSLLEKISSAASRAGARVHVVGGYPRDVVLEREPDDIDLLVEGDPAPFLDALEALAGRRPVAFSRRPPETWRLALDGRTIDVASYEAGRLTQALLRRDFTINALAAPLEPPGKLGPILDVAGGIGDLESGLIREIDPANLDDDPLRLLRGVRLTVCLEGFRMTPDLESLVRRRGAALASVAAERIRSEMGRILASPRAGGGLRQMHRLGLLFPVFHELAPLEGLGQNEWHEHDALEHTLRAAEAADDLQAAEPLEQCPAEILKWAALYHDTGKARTRTVGEDGRIHFYGHETVSADLATAALTRLRVEKDICSRVTNLVRHHLRLTMLESGPPVTARALRRFVHLMGRDLPLACLLALADRRAAGGADAQRRVERMEDLVERALEVWRERGEEIISMKPLLDGDEVMRLLGIEPGPRVGSVLRWLLRLQLDGEISSRREAVERLRGLPPARLPSSDPD